MDTQKPYAGVSSETRLVPAIRYENQWVRVMGLGAEVKLPSIDLGGSQKIEFGLPISYGLGAGYKPGDSPILSGMEERKAGFWAGARATWRNDVANVSASWQHDVSGYSNGERISLGVDKTWQIGQRWRLTPRVGLNWMDNKYVDYYYGVQSNEVSANRPFYTGKSTLNTELGARMSYLIDPSNAIFLDVSVTNLGSGIKDSPLVDRSTVNRVSIGYLYRFQ